MSMIKVYKIKDLLVFLFTLDLFQKDFLPDKLFVNFKLLIERTIFFFLLFNQFLRIRLTFVGIGLKDVEFG